MTSRLAWFLTSNGRKFSLVCMSVATVGTFGWHYVPQSFFLYKYKETVSMYESALPVPLSDSLKKLWDKTLSDLSLPDFETNLLDPFVVFGFDVFHAGSTALRNGAIIGIPINFTYKDVKMLDPSPILVNNETVNWNREDAKQLLQSLILSDNAKRYAIAREILMSRYNEPLVSAVCASFFMSTTYMICRGLNDRFNLRLAPLPIRGILYCMTGLLTYGCWATQSDLLNTYREKETDNHLVQLGDNYKTGAIEFYDKLLKRNVSLRSLLGEQGESVFTPTGNERHLFRQPRLPIDARKEFFEKKLLETTTETEIEEGFENIPQTM